MAKCAACGKSIGLFSKKVKFDSDLVCESCITGWGFTLEEAEERNRGGWKYLSRGKAAVLEAQRRNKYISEHTKQKRFKIFGEGKNENGEDIAKLMDKLPAELIDEDDLYSGYKTKKDMVDRAELDHEYYIYSGETLDVDLVPTDDGVKVIFEGHHLGDLPKAAKNILAKNEYVDYDIMFLGGKYKMLTGDEYEGYTVERGKEDYYAVIQMEWVDWSEYDGERN